MRASAKTKNIVNPINSQYKRHVGASVGDRPMSLREAVTLPFDDAPDFDENGKLINFA